MGIDFEEKAFYDILKFVANEYEFEYPENKMIELSKRIKTIVDDKARYTDWAVKDDIKAALQFDLAVVLDKMDIRLLRLMTFSRKSLNRQRTKCCLKGRRLQRRQ